MLSGSHRPWEPVPPASPDSPVDEVADADAGHGWRGLVVDQRSAGRRVDAWLRARFPDWSRTAIARFIRSGEIRSEDRQLKPSSTLFSGERLRIFVPGLAPDSPPPPLPDILYEDDRLIAFDKPAGLLVHPSGQRWVWALIGLARQARPGARLDLVHRLDRETSGVVVLTKDLDANSHLKKALQEHRVRKTYHALVRGLIPWERRELVAALGSREDSEIRIRQGVRPDGNPARTDFRVLQRLEAHTLVACYPQSGRTHQIRAHLEHLGFPILGDKLYGHEDAVFLRLLEAGADPFVRAATGFPRHALHAARLDLPHPDGWLLRLVAPLPADMAAVVAGTAPCWPDESDAPAALDDEAAGDDDELPAG